MSDIDLRALKALSRLRRAETDAARRGLGEALGRETALSERDTAMADELDAARQITGDFDRDAFSAWFGQMLAVRARLASELREAEADTASARTELSNRRVAETSAKDALARAALALEAAVAKREQIMLEDVARVLKRAMHK